MPPKPLSPIERWKATALALPAEEYRITVPFHVLLGESVDVAKFFDTYFKSVDAGEGRPARPGLDTVADKKRGLTAKTGEEILSLREAVQHANTAYLLSASPKGAAPMERGRFLVDEISSTLEWLFDDGVEDERDAQLANVARAHEGTPDSADALAAELEDYAALASAYRAEIDGLGGFDVAFLDEAVALAEQLRNRPPTPIALSQEAAATLALRNRLATLLSTRMNLVRASARFVFRRHPEIAREATSVYERRRRANARRNASKKAPAPASPSAPPE